MNEPVHSIHFPKSRWAGRRYLPPSLPHIRHISFQLPNLSILSDLALNLPFICSLRALCRLVVVLLAYPASLIPIHHDRRTAFNHSLALLAFQNSRRRAMAGGALYETSHHSPMPSQELLTDWTSSIAGTSGALRSEKDWCASD